MLLRANDLGFAPAGRQRRSPGPLRPAVPGRAAVPIASVTATQLGEHLGLTRQRIRVLADIENVIERLPNGRFNLDRREVQYSAGLMRYLNSRIQSCYCAPIIWVFAPKNRETERVTLAMDDGRGLPPRRSPRYYRERDPPGG